jgi:hydroxyethylthiazole kinase-like uncharacterized protein yjeF
MNDLYIPDIKKLLPKRADNAHKGTLGRIGIIAGSTNMMGAAILTARATLRAGSGLVYLMTVTEAIPQINICYPEIIVLPLKSVDGHLCEEALSDISHHIKEKKIDVLAIGPGLGQNPSTKNLVKALIFGLATSEKITTVIDADALNAIKQNDFTNIKETQFVLTPHPKEFEQVFGVSTSDDQTRIRETRKAAIKIKQTVLLKGKNTVISNKDKLYINPTGNPGMATAGSGDALTGIIASFIGQGTAPFEASVLGTYIHGLAGDLAYKENNYGLIASDIIDNIAKAIKVTKK